MNPDYIIQDGKPTYVIFTVEDYQELLDLLEDIEDLHEIQEMRKTPQEFFDLDDVLDEIEKDV